MPRYFFHYRQGDERSCDDQGLEFDSFEAAYLSAFKGALDMWTELMRLRVDPRDCSFEVTDEKDRQMFVLPFGEVLESCKSADRHPAVAEVKPTVRRVLEQTAAYKLEARQSMDAFHKEMMVTRQVMWESKRLIAAVTELARDMGGEMPELRRPRL